MSFLTVFLTPALRNIDRPLTTDIEIVGRPREVYTATLQLLDDVYKKKVKAMDLLIEAIRILLLVRNENQERMKKLLFGLERAKGSLALSCEGIVTLVSQHLACKNSSRLPVLIVASAYQCASTILGEFICPLNSHTAADLQTGAIGDVEVCLVGEDNVVTAYEMKMKRVTIDDIDTALLKIAKTKPQIDNYIFITTDVIEEEVSEYASSLYEKTDGTEVAILNCIQFLRHFLHLFHRLRIAFLDTYQDFVMKEPVSAVSQPLKEAFLALRSAAESDYQ